MKKPNLTIGIIVLNLFFSSYGSASDFTWSLKSPMQQSRSHCASVALNGKIYAIGSYVGGHNGTTSVEEYDPATDTWTSKAPISNAVWGLRAAVANGKIYVFGGANNPGGNSTFFSTVEEYDPVANTWTPKSPMSEAKYNMAIAVFNDKIYIIGGTRGDVAFDAIEEYNPLTDTWTTKTPMPFHRHNQYFAQLRDKVYLFGNPTYVYDIATESWSHRAAPPFDNVGAPAAAAMNGKIYVFGGSFTWGSTGPVGISDVYEYEPSTDTWSAKTPMVTGVALLWQGASVVGNKVYVLGGQTAYPTQSTTLVQEGTFTPADLSDGLVAYYPFNGNANDESGNGNHGSLIGGATWTTGVLDGAVHLDGTGYINVPDSPSLDLSGGTGTIAAFIRVDPASNMSNEFGVSKESSSSYASTIAYELLVRETASGKMVEYCLISDGTSFHYINNDDGESLKDSLWHHIALTWSGPGGKFVAYRDGVVVSQADQTISTINNIPEPVLVGAFRWNVPPGILRKMIGDLDEVRIYNRALSANEISELAGITESTEGWIAFGSNRDGDLDIWAVRPDGTDLRQITNLPGSELTPQWSPDSTKIAYVDSEQAQVWVYDWFTGTNIKIYDGDDYGGMFCAYEPAWSPDGSRILFVEQTTYNNPHITVINADGTGRQVVPVQAGYVGGPSWCSSGTAFVCSIRNSGASYSHDLWIYDFTATGDITSGVNHRLTVGAGSESTTKNYPDWTPSGKILFTWGHNLVLIDPGRSPNWNGSISSPSDPHVTFLTNDAGYPSIVYSYPSWSPDLSQIVYADESARTGGVDIWIIDAFPRGNRYPVIASGSYPDWGNPIPKPPPPPKVYYVDAVNGNDNNDGLTRRTAFDTIKKGVDSARNGFKVLVYPGVYQEEVDFKGKAITVQGVATKAGIPVIENPGDFAVSFYNSEGPRSILKNFVVRNSFMAIFIAGSSPTLKNLNIIANKYGIEAYAGSETDISNCIFWENSDSDIFGCEARYSCTSEPGQGNIAADPCFVDPNNSDYHLLSQRGRYWPRADVWVLDKVTSPCVDGGDPDDDVLDEPMPNGGRIDMGAFGGTPFASMSETKWLNGDINHDGVVNLIDLAMLAENWLSENNP